MKKNLSILFVWAIVIFLIDQSLKQIFINGFRWQSEYIDLVLTYNDGVAFSMFAFLGAYLKYIQIILLLGVLVYVLSDKKMLSEHASAFGIILGAGSGNIIDRFVHTGVVDYVFWHKWFNFAVFNFADVMIDLAVVMILLKSYILHKKTKKNSYM